MTYTTLNKIRDWQPCSDGWKKLLLGLSKTESDDEPLELVKILEINGLDDAIWSIRCVEGTLPAQLFVLKMCRQIQHLMPDPRSIYALDVTELHCHGYKTFEQVVKSRQCAKKAMESFESTDMSLLTARAAYYATFCNPQNYAYYIANIAYIVDLKKYGQISQITQKQADLFLEVFG